MGFPYYRFPESLQQVWWKPLEMAGFTIKLTVDAQGTHEENQEGTIHFREAEVIIGITQTIDSTSGKVETDAIVLPKTHNTADDILAANVERVLFASGASKCGSPLGCKRLYRSPVSLVANWSERLRTQGYHVDLLQTQGPAQHTDSLSPDYAGTVRKCDVSVAVFTGPGIDPDTGKFTHYIALDYHPALFRRARTRQVVDELEKVLVSQGAQRMEIIHPGP